MKYLNAVVKEGLRMFPPVPLFARRVTEDFESGNDCNFAPLLLVVFLIWKGFLASAGYKIPVGSTAMVIPFLIHRNPKVWDKPDEFRPERFLSENHDQERHAFSYVPFSAGARNCIGESQLRR